MSLSHPTLLDQRPPDHIRASPCPACYLCGAAGEPLYLNLQDRLFGAKGNWDLKRCPEPCCGLIWLDPMPSEEDIGKAYQDYFTHVVMNLSSRNWLKRAYGHVKNAYWARKYGYGEETVGRWKQLLGMTVRLHPGLSAELDFRVMYLRSQKNGHLLDVGCGSGLVLRCMAELGWQVKGVDFDPKAVQIARENGLEVCLGRLEDQAYSSDCFDVVTMSHLIEHVHDPLSLLKECRRILKPGGRVVIVTPNSGSWGHRKYGSNWMHLDPPRHLHIFNGQSLRGLIALAGFRTIDICTTIRDADGVFIGSRSIERTGRHRMGLSHHTLLRRLWGRITQFAEWVLLKSEPHLGEEIALVATKEPAVQC
jgi:2-polyprenyl-3-methyl-5-hydroxy-6-metoxy-1,4-benzoquinol methylase